MTDDHMVLAHGDHAGDMILMHLTSMEQLGEFFDVLGTITTVGEYND